MNWPEATLSKWLPLEFSPVLSPSILISKVIAGFTLAMIGSGGEENPAPGIRTIWGVVLGALGLAMIFVGDVTLVRSVIALSAIAFVFIVPVLVICLLRSLGKEGAE